MAHTPGHPNGRHRSKMLTLISIVNTRICPLQTVGKSPSPQYEAAYDSTILEWKSRIPKPKN